MPALFSPLTHRALLLPASTHASKKGINRLFSGDTRACPASGLLGTRWRTHRIGIWRDSTAVSGRNMATVQRHTLAHRGEVGDLRGAATGAGGRTNGGAGLGQQQVRTFAGSQNGGSQATEGVRTKTTGRRLIIGCDGTWLNSDSTPKIPSNITRLCRALANNSSSRKPDTTHVEQIVYYQRGIGSEGDAEDKYIVGGTGSSLSEHVRQCYGFLVNNWREGDEIFLFGFSRGAYTVRAISSLISDVGLLNCKGMEFFYEIFEDWLNQNLVAKTPVAGPITTGVFQGLPERPVMPTQAYRDALLSKGLARTPIPIKVLGVYDTVGHLGIPHVLGLNLSEHELMQFSFVNTKVSQVLEHAFQALALDEHRAAFSPTLWESPDPPNRLKTLKQCWFPGVHCNIGGSGYEDEGLSLAALAWMVSLIQETDPSGPMLDIDEDYLKWVFQKNIEHCDTYYTMQQEIDLAKKEGKDIKDMNIGPLGFRGWALGRIEETDTGIYAVTGERKPFSTDSSVGILQRVKDWWRVGDEARTPGRYREIDAKTGEERETGKMLQKTGEKVHRSVRARIVLGGRGLLDEPGYGPRGLKGVTLVGVGAGGKVSADPEESGYKWVGKGLGQDKTDLVLEEEELLGFEKVYLNVCNDAMKARAAGKVN